MVLLVPAVAVWAFVLAYKSVVRSDQGGQSLSAKFRDGSCWLCRAEK